MSRYAEVAHAETAEQFAVLVETAEGVDTYGVSPLGQEWERWIDNRPPKQRKNLEQLLDTLGHHLTIDGPKPLTKAKKLEFQNLITESETRELQSVAEKIDE